MAVNVTIGSKTGKDAFSMHEVVLTRRTNAAVAWCFTILLRGGIEEREILARHFSQEICWARAGLEDRGDLSPKVRLLTANWLSESDGLLMLEGTSTFGGDADDNKDPYVLRRRVHKSNDCAGLLQPMHYFAELPDGIEAALAEVKFPHGEHSCVLQSDLSDWEFVQVVLEHFAAVRKERIVLTGAAEPDRRGRWLAVWASQASYEKRNSMERRVVNCTGSESLNFRTGSLCEREASLGMSGLPCVCRKYGGRDFSADEWRNWTTRTVPLFTEKKQMIWSITDRLSWNQGVDADWSTELMLAPSAYPATRPLARPTFKVWAGTGRVIDNQTAPWLKVSLAGFPKDNAEGEAWVRLTTPYSGKNGRKGIHLVPEKDTETAVLWSGRIGDSAVSLVNIRGENVDMVSPMIELESPLKMLLQQTEVEVTRMSLKGSDRVQVEASGVRVKLDGGKFRTERGL